MIADGQREDEGRRDQPSIRLGAPRRVRGAGAVLPADEQARQGRGDREVQPVGLRMGADRPRGRGEAETEAGQDAEGGRAGQGPRQHDRGAGSHTEADRREEVHPERRLAERFEHDRRQPGEDHPRREAGRMGRAEQRADRLVLAGVPVAQAGHERQPGGHEDGETHRDGRDDRHDDAHEAPGSLHHPSNRPQATPQKLIAIEATTRIIPSGMAQR